MKLRTHFLVALVGLVGAAAPAGAQDSVPLPVPVPPPSATAQDSLAPDVYPQMIAPGSLQTQLARSASRLLRDDDALAGRQLPLRVVVDVRADGSIGDARLQQSSGFPAVDAEALRIMRGMRFTPAMQKGRAVQARVVQPIRFVFEQ